MRKNRNRRSAIHCAMVQTLEQRQLLAVNWAGTWTLTGNYTRADAAPGTGSTVSQQTTGTLTLTAQDASHYRAQAVFGGSTINYTYTVSGDDLVYTDEQTRGKKTQLDRSILHEQNGAMVFLYSDADLSADKSEFLKTSGFSGIATRGKLVATPRPFAGSYTLQTIEFQVHKPDASYTIIDGSSAGQVTVTDLGGGSFTVDAGDGALNYQTLSGGVIGHSEVSDISPTDHTLTQGYIRRGPNDVLVYSGFDLNYGGTVQDLWSSTRIVGILVPQPGFEYRPDLVPVLDQFERTVIPGEKITIPVAIENRGSAPFSGTVTVNLYLNPADDPIGTLTTGLSIPGTSGLQVSSKVVNVTVPFTSGMADAGSYTLHASISPSPVNTVELRTDNNSATGAADAFHVAWDFGLIGGRQRKLVYIDADGDFVTFKLTGGGRGTFDGTGVDVRDTTASSSLKIAVKKAIAGNGSINLDSITSAQLLRTINAPAANLKGNASGQANLELNTAGADPLVSSVAIKMGTFSDVTVDTNTLPIRSMRIADWKNTLGDRDTLQAPWIKSMMVRDRLGIAPGVLDADINLDHGAPPLALSLGTLRVAGTWTGDLNANAGLGRLIIGGNMASADLSTAGNLASLSVAGQMQDTELRIAHSVGKITVGAMGGSNILVGIRSDFPAGQTTAQALSDFADPAARLGIFAVRFPAVGQMAYVQNSNISAPIIGKVVLGNLDPATFKIVAADLLGSPAIIQVFDTATGTTATWKYGMTSPAYLTML